MNEFTIKITLEKMKFYLQLHSQNLTKIIWKEQNFAKLPIRSFLYKTLIGQIYGEFFLKTWSIEKNSPEKHIKRCGVNGIIN